MCAIITITPENVLTAANFLLEFNQTCFLASAKQTAHKLKAELAESLVHYQTNAKSTISGKFGIEGFEQALVDIMTQTQLLVPHLTSDAKQALSEILQLHEISRKALPPV